MGMVKKIDERFRGNAAVLALGSLGSLRNCQKIGQRFRGNAVVLALGSLGGFIELMQDVNDFLPCATGQRCVVFRNSCFSSLCRRPERGAAHVFSLTTCGGLLERFPCRIAVRDSAFFTGRTWLLVRHSE